MTQKIKKVQLIIFHTIYVFHPIGYRARRLLDSRSKIDEDRNDQLETELKAMTITADEMASKYEEVGNFDGDVAD